MDMCLNSLWDMVKDREAWSGDIHGVTKSQKKLKDWTSQLQNPWFNQLIVQPLCWLNWLVAFKSVLQIKNGESEKVNFKSEFDLNFFE